MQIIIAIDGYSSCGKSTVAKELAKKLGYTYIDSGAMYRAVKKNCNLRLIILISVLFSIPPFKSMKLS
jgi:cytidylate kinase